MENVKCVNPRGGGSLRLRPGSTNPYRQLARTCPGCGDLLTTPDPLIRKDAGPLPKCARCRTRKAVERRRKRSSIDPEYRKRLRANTARNQGRRELETTPTAARSGYEWTGPELEVAARPDLTARQAAEMIGRSYYAVKRARWRINMDPRKARLADVPGPVADRADP